MGLLLRKFNRPVLDENGFAAQGCGCGSGKRVKSDAAGPPTGNEAPCVQLLSYNGGRSEPGRVFAARFPLGLIDACQSTSYAIVLRSVALKSHLKSIEPGS